MHPKNEVVPKHLNHGFWKLSSLCDTADARPCLSLQWSQRCWSPNSMSKFNKEILHEKPAFCQVEPADWSASKLRKTGPSCWKHSYLNQHVKCQSVNFSVKMYLLHCKSFSHFYRKSYWCIYVFSISFTNDNICLKQLNPGLCYSASACRASCELVTHEMLSSNDIFLMGVENRI